MPAENRTCIDSIVHKVHGSSGSDSFKQRGCNRIDTSDPWQQPWMGVQHPCFRCPDYFRTYNAHVHQDDVGWVQLFQRFDQLPAVQKPAIYIVLCKGWQLSTGNGAKISIALELRENGRTSVLDQVLVRTALGRNRPGHHNLEVVMLGLEKI